MTDDDLSLLLRSKTALGRLSEIEVHAVLKFLDGIGFARPTAPTGAAAPVDVVVPTVELTGAPVVPPVLPPAPPAVPAPSILASLESAIEKDVEAFLHPAPPAPPAA